MGKMFTYNWSTQSRTSSESPARKRKKRRVRFSEKGSLLKKVRVRRSAKVNFYKFIARKFKEYLQKKQNYIEEYQNDDRKQVLHLLSKMQSDLKVNQKGITKQKFEKLLDLKMSYGKANFQVLQKLIKLVSEEIKEKMKRNQCIQYLRELKVYAYRLHSMQEPKLKH